MARVLVAGCGYVGAALAGRLAAAGHRVWGLRRRPAGLPAGIAPFPADLGRPETLRDLPAGLDVVVCAAGPDARDEPAYRAAYLDGPRRLLAALAGQGQRPRRVFFLSSTGVYAQTDGAWVDEASLAEGADAGGRILLLGEAAVLGGPFPATVVRLGGIYGPGRARLVSAVRRGQATCPDGPPRYANRIHRDDCAGVLHHLTLLPDPAPLYLAVDREPTDPCTVARWLAARLGVPPPPVSPPSPARPRGHRRVSNRRLLASGYVFRYPTFREGYAALLGEPG